MVLPLIIICLHLQERFDLMRSIPNTYFSVVGEDIK